MLLLGFALILFGCEEKPEYPEAPIISYKGLEFIPSTSDTLAVTFSFQDGDGDLGLGGEELYPPFGPSDPYNKNCLISFYRIRNGSPQIVEVLENPDNNLSGRFPILNPNEEGTAPRDDNPIDGEIRYTMTSSAFSFVFPPTDTVEFTVRIVDRALNVSNTIRTPRFRFVDNGISFVQ